MSDKTIATHTTQHFTPNEQAAWDAGIQAGIEIGKNNTIVKIKEWLNRDSQCCGKCKDEA